MSLRPSGQLGSAFRKPLRFPVALPGGALVHTAELDVDLEGDLAYAAGPEARHGVPDEVMPGLRHRDLFFEELRVVQGPDAVAAENPEAQNPRDMNGAPSPRSGRHAELGIDEVLIRFR